MSIVITAGNHDAATRLEAPRDILEAIQVHVVGNIRRRDKHTLSDRHLIPIHSPDRHLLGHILAVSYPTASCLPAVSPDGSHTRIIRQTTTLYQTLLNQTRDTWAGLPLILTGHLHVHGATETASSERRILIGGENAFPAALFPEEANYVALGHLHKPQQAGAPHIRYSGSLFPLSAAEADYPHSVTLVEIDKQQLTTQQLPIFRPVPFHRLPHKGFAPFDTIESLLDRIQPDQAIPPDQYPFVQLRLSRPNLPTLFREKLDQYADRYRLRLVETRLEDAPGSPLTLAPTPTTTVSDLDPSYFFDLAFQRTFNAPPDPPHKEIFSQIYQQAVSR